MYTGHGNSVPSNCQKSPSGLFDKVLQSAACINCLPVADNFHTCSLRSIFGQVHAPAEDDLDPIRRLGGELCEAFLTH